MELDKNTREWLMTFKAQLIDKGLAPDTNGTHDNTDQNTCSAIIPHPDFNPTPNRFSLYKVGEIWAE